MVKVMTSSLQLIKLQEQGIQALHTGGVLVSLGNQFEVMTDVSHLVEQEQSLLVTLTDVLEVL